MVPLILAAALAAAPAPAATATPTPQRMLGLIRAKFRSHRPPPPYIEYTMERKQLTEQGYPDYADSYTEKIWCRTVDRAALARRVYRSINRGELTFERPAFNEARDPGPPTADLFEPAPSRPHPVSEVPTPEPSAGDLRVLATVVTTGEFDYRIVSTSYEGDLVKLVIEPTRDPDRNRLREIDADRQTYELRKLVATDKLFIMGSSDVYGVTFTITVGSLQGIPVVTDIHGVVGDGYQGDGTTIDYQFRKISFPPTVPAWYFDPKAYAGHEADAPI